MKKILLASGAVILTIGFISAGLYSEETKSSGAHPGATGAPGEHTCADAQVGCHADATISAGDGVNSLLIEGSTNQYKPNDTNEIILRSVSHNTGKYGFEITALDKDYNTLGTFVVTDKLRTQKISDKVGEFGVLRHYVTHRIQGTTPIAGAGEWKFQWVAPENYSDTIRFYYATNAANNDGQNTGDRLFLSSTFATALGSDVEQNAEESFSIYFDEISLSLNCNFPSDENFSGDIRILDLSGKVVLEKKISGRNIFLGNIAPGIYFAYFDDGKNSFAKKFLVAN